MVKNRCWTPALHLAAVVSGFLVNPAWFLWLGAALWRNPSASAAGKAG